ncbi:cupin domain-containing protein [Deinococcus sp.]|uniref:cupin domain-containing protein n=1 Tax=Deinococcus sp. TaxID=47478 RepID=UPI0025C1BB19|nr:cupin domain-containing protein [Deinococcus sp.]
MTDLPAGITKAGTSTTGSEWRILGHTYHLKSECDSSFSFETYDPAGTFVPPHIHTTQDEFIYVLEGRFDLYLDGNWAHAEPGDLVRMPRGLAHGYYNKTDKPARALFWVSPAGNLKALFDQLHDLADPDEVAKRSAAHDVNFLPPGAVEGA